MKSSITLLLALSLLVISVSASLGCGGARPPLLGLGVAAETGNLGVRDAPLTLGAPLTIEGFFGGPVAAPSDPGLEGCAGYFTGAPDVVLRRADAALRVSLVAEGHAALLVRDATGAWRCADGSIELSAEATAGQVRVWVGAPSPEAVVEARLTIERS
jgi:hypothetical protein